MSRPARPPQPQRRDGYWYFTRQVPEEFRAIEPRPRVFKTTGIAILDDPRAVRAKIVIAKLNAELTQYWEDKRAGRDPTLRLTYRAAVETCENFGVRYLERPAVEALPARQFVDRLRLLRHVPDSPQLLDRATALHGLIVPPGLMLSELRQEGERHLGAELKQKSANQIRRWRTIRDRAIAVFTEVIGGDRPLKQLTRQDVVAVRDHWVQRIRNENIAVNTANKNLGRVAGLFNVVNDMQQLGLPALFDKIHIKGEESKKRIKYETAFIQDHFLAEGMFADVNEEARRVVYLLIETGLRPSEAVNLRETSIYLDCDIPHIAIEPVGRQLKTKKSKRLIPLVGVSLLAMRAQPKGFPRYRDKENSFSGLINKVLDARKLRPAGPDQSLYSLRHSFSDRLRKEGCDGAIIDKMMGHAPKGMDYGDVADLELKRDWLLKIALKPPLAV